MDWWWFGHITGMSTDVFLYDNKFDMNLGLRHYRDFLPKCATWRKPGEFLFPAVYFDGSKYPCVLENLSEVQSCLVALNNHQLIMKESSEPFLVFFSDASRYIDLRVQGKALTISPLTEKLQQYKACLRYYDTVDCSYTKASTESNSDIPHCELQCQWRWHFF